MSNVAQSENEIRRKNCLNSMFQRVGWDGSRESSFYRTQYLPDLSSTSLSCLNRLNANVMDLFHHDIGVLHDPIFNPINADALRAESPGNLPIWRGGILGYRACQEQG